MAKNQRLEELRAQARDRHKAATRKVSRLKSNKDVEISGTKLDPRRDLGNLKRYNSKQLEAYIGQLNNFVSRETSYVAGAKRKPLEGNLWGTYKALENALRQKNAKPFDTVKDIFVPSLGMTAGEFQGTKPAHPVTGNPASRAPHLVYDRSPKGIPNEKQLKKLIRETKQKLDPSYDDKVLRREQKTLRKMLSDIGEVAEIGDIKKAVKGLTKGQFNFLWNYTHFATVASFEYQIARSKMNDNKSVAAFDAAFDTQLREMRNLIKDAKNLNL